MSNELFFVQILRKLEERGVDLDRLQEMSEKDIGALIRYVPGGKVVLHLLLLLNIFCDYFLADLISLNLIWIYFF